MPSLKSIRTRISSVKSTQKITRAMKLVSAARLRRAQDAILGARPYANALAAAVVEVALRAGADAHPLLDRRTPERITMVPLTSDRGLAGGFNSGIVRLAREKIAALVAEGKDVKIITVGRKARDQLRRTYGNRYVESFEVGIKTPGLALARPIAQRILELFNAGEVDVVTLVYSRYKSVVTQTPTAMQLIPATVEAAQANAARPYYDYEPDESEILAELLPRNITVQVLSALLENQAGFFAAQMAAMDSATRNAGDLIKALTIQMNRTRQAQITKELIEIISGASAV
jgi:F-type H+-transporting ATPase subunit gamma